MEITAQEFHQIVEFIRHNYGVNLADKKVLVTGRLSNILLREGYTCYADYMQKVIANPFGAEATSLVNSLTTNHTFFLREPVHFNFLREKVLPELKEKERQRRDLGIWSAASSSGEEAYTLAMVLREFFQLEPQEWDTRILATDISQKALAAAKEAVYDFEHIKDLPKSWIHRFFTRNKEGLYALNPEIKSQVIFRHFNLMDSFSFRRKFHIVFLRNVMIYFDEETKIKLLEKVYEVMEPGGYLFIGTTEIIDKSRSKFIYMQPSIYRK